MHLAAAETKSGNVAGVERSIAVIADASRPAWQRSALVQGLDLALPSTGAAGRGRGGGGIGLPGPQRSAIARRDQSGRGMSLGGEPAALARVAAGTGELAETASRVLAKLNWPGRPAPVAVATPLTPAEQQRYAAGAAVYKNVCVGCHQDDGRGNATLGANLVDSTFVNGARSLSERPGRARRQRRIDWDDAAARPFAQRRPDCVGCHVYSSGLGAYRHGRQPPRGERSARAEPQSHASVDRRRASAGRRPRWRPGRTRSGRRVEGRVRGVRRSSRSSKGSKMFEGWPRPEP